MQAMEPQEMHRVAAVVAGVITRMAEPEQQVGFSFRNRRAEYLLPNVRTTRPGA